MIGDMTYTATIDRDITRFVDEACSVGGGDQSMSSELHAAYLAWCDRIGIGPVYRANLILFGRRLTALGYRKRRRQQGVIYLGIHPR